MMNQPNPILSSRDEEHMLGHGFYNKHSHEQRKANTYGLPLFVDAVKAIDLSRSFFLAAISSFLEYFIVALFLFAAAARCRIALTPKSTDD
jgi:hypothetical protein